MRSPLWLRLGTRCANWIRLQGRYSHEKRLRQARQVIATVREFQGDALEARTLCYLRKIDPWVFEEVVLHSLEEAGAAVWRNTRYTNDGGVDGLVNLPPWRGFCPVQTKRYANHICRAHVVDFYELLYRQGHRAGLFVHTGKTSQEVRETMPNMRVILCSGEKLAKLVRLAQLPL